MRFLLCVVVVTVSACAIRPNPADLVVTNAVVWTGTARGATAEAVAVRDGRILAVGSAGEIDDYIGPSTEVMDVDGRLVVPGFIDAHAHFLSGGFQLASVDLRDADSPEEFSARLRAFAAGQPRGTWITGGDWDHERWPGAPLPDRAWIDSVTSEHPVFVSRLDGHMGLANTRALELAGVGQNTPDPDGGTIVRHTSGRPTGVLKDAAMDFVWAVRPPRTHRELDQALERAQQHALEHGVTSVHDMAGWEDLETYRRARGRGALRTRIYSLVPISSWERLRDYVAAEGRGDARLRWGGLKGFVDGSLGSTTAWFHEPYVDSPETSGLMITDTARLRDWIIDADAAGLHVAVHAIGDRANDWLLDVYADAQRLNGERDRRFRVEHAQHLTRAAIPRFAELGVIPSMQPYHAADDGRWAEKRIGAERARTTYAFRDLLDAGARPAFGSDWTVAPMNPLLGIQAAVTRQTLDGAHPGGWVPEQKITVEEALLGYTRDAARAGRAEDHVGTIREGRFADMVVLDRNILDTDPTAIDDARVIMTMIDGEVVFRAPSAW